MDFNENKKGIAICYRKVMLVEDEGYLYVPHRVIIGHKIKKGKNYYFKEISGTYLPFYNYANNYPDEVVDSYNSIKKVIKPYKYVNLDLQELLEIYLDHFKDEILYININKNKVFFFNKDTIGMNDKIYCSFEQKYFEILQQKDQNKNGLKTTDTNILLPISKENNESKKENEIIDKENQTLEADFNYLDGLVQIINNIQKNILHQDRQIKEVIAQVYKSMITYADDDNYIKSNIIINGNTGVGKTEIARQLSKELNIPVVIEDINSLTPTGYVGASVTDMLIDLYYAADCDLMLAQKGILVIDEIDKKIGLEKDDQSNLKNDVLNNLLKLIEGGTYNINIGSNSNPNNIEFDTSKLIILMLGTFNNVKQNKPISLGFGKNNSNEVVLNNEKFGLSDEFYGRVSNIVTLNDLTEEDLYDILLNSNLSPIKRYQKLSNMLNIKIDFSEKVLRGLANEAYKLKSGARGLFKIVTNYFNDQFIYVLDQYNNEDENEKIIEKQKGKSI